MTPLDKAEAVLAAFRGEVECSTCHRYVAYEDLMAVWTEDIDGSQFQRLACQDCWRNTLDQHDKIHVMNLMVNDAIRLVKEEANHDATR